MIPDPILKHSTMRSAVSALFFPAAIISQAQTETDVNALIEAPGQMIKN